MRYKIVAVTGVLLLLVTAGVVLAATDYGIGRSVVSPGGGERASENYMIRDVIGEPAVGIAQSDNYQLRAGFLPLITTEVYIEVPLIAGWNMVSVPVMPTDNSTSAVFPGVAGIFTWNSTSRSYYVPTIIDPEKGYWVAVTTDTTITVSGTAVYTWTTDIKAGWNMIGSVTTNSSVVEPNDDPDGSVIPTAYWWDPVARAYTTTTDIEPGKGYWAASIQDCTLTLP